jgi:hypothetical protein
MVRRPRCQARLEGSGVDLREPKPGDVVQALSGSKSVGNAPEVPTVGTEGVGGSPTRSELGQEGSISSPTPGADDRRQRGALGAGWAMP